MTRFDHVTLTAVDFAASPAFYDAVLGALGLARVAELVDEDVDAEADAAPLEAVGWGTGGAAVLWLVAGQLPTSGLHGQLRTDSRVQVDTFPAEALRTGGREHRAPRRWPLYRRGEFNAIVADPAGNLIEAVGPE